MGEGQLPYLGERRNLKMRQFKPNRLKKDYFLWPECNVLKGVASAYNFTSTTEIEITLKNMFPSGFPVLCSSGRSALSFALIESSVKRNDLVGIFPYASHCVLDAISRIATPLPGFAATRASLRVVYHQWGYVQETNLAKNSIEDCVDTLCVPGTTLFPGGGRFEIWSLPKILGTTSGGVLWCRDEETAKKIRNLRDSKGSGLFQWFLRLCAQIFNAAYTYWQGAECDRGNVSRFQTGEILEAIRKWDFFVDARFKNLEEIWPLAVDWLAKPTDRLPPVVPVHVDNQESEIYQYGISSGFRMFEYLKNNSERKLLKVLPVPIHQDITSSWLVNIIKNLDYSKSESR